MVENPFRNADLVTVIVPTFKQAGFLPQALNSILNQIYPRLEVIIVTVKGDEATDKVVQPYTSANDNIIQIVSKIANNIHQRNLGTEQAKGKFICSFASDDWMLPTKIAQEWLIAKTQDAVLVYSSYINTDENLTPTILAIYVDGDRRQLVLDIPNFEEPSYHELLTNDYMYDYSLVRRDMHEEFGPFDTNLKWTAVYDKWLQIAEKYLHKIRYNPCPTFFYRHHKTQMSLKQHGTAKNQKLMDKVRLASIRRYQALHQEWKPIHP